MYLTVVDFLLDISELVFIVSLFALAAVRSLSLKEYRSASTLGCGVALWKLSSWQPRACLRQLEACRFIMTHDSYSHDGFFSIALSLSLDQTMQIYDDNFEGIPLCIVWVGNIMTLSFFIAGHYSIISAMVYWCWMNGKSPFSAEEIRRCYKGKIKLMLFWIMCRLSKLSRQCSFSGAYWYCQKIKQGIGVFFFFGGSCFFFLFFSEDKENIKRTGAEKQEGRTVGRQVGRKGGRKEGRNLGRQAGRKNLFTSTKYKILQIAWETDISNKK